MSNIGRIRRAASLMLRPVEFDYHPVLLSRVNSASKRENIGLQAQFDAVEAELAQRTGVGLGP